MPCPPNTISYIIRQGDTLFALAAQYNTTVPAIVSANPGIDPQRLTVGQEICIPQQAVYPPCPEGNYYTSGRRTLAIARRFLSLDDLLEATRIEPFQLRLGRSSVFGRTPVCPRIPHTPSSRAIRSCAGAAVRAAVDAAFASERQPQRAAHRPDAGAFARRARLPEGAGYRGAGVRSCAGAGTACRRRCGPPANVAPTRCSSANGVRSPPAAYARRVTGATVVAGVRSLRWRSGAA